MSDPTLIGGMNGHVISPLGQYAISSQARLGIRNSLKLAKMSTSETINTGKEKLDTWLQEKNFFTDALEKVEKKTGVKRIYLFLGNSINYLRPFEWTFIHVGRQDSASNMGVLVFFQVLLEYSLSILCLAMEQI